MQMVFDPSKDIRSVVSVYVYLSYNTATKVLVAIRNYLFFEIVELSDCSRITVDYDTLRVTVFRHFGV